MKRFLILFVALGLLAGSVVTAEAAKTPTRHARTVKATYAGPWLPFGNWDCAAPIGRGCVSVTTRSNETYLNAKVTDAHGQPVRVMVWSEYQAWVPARSSTVPSVVRPLPRSSSPQA